MTRNQAQNLTLFFGAWGGFSKARLPRPLCLCSSRSSLADTFPCCSSVPPSYFFFLCCCPVMRIVVFRVCFGVPLVVGETVETPPFAAKRAATRRSLLSFFPSSASAPAANNQTPHDHTAAPAITSTTAAHNPFFTLLRTTPLYTIDTRNARASTPIHPPRASRRSNPPRPIPSAPRIAWPPPPPPLPIRIVRRPSPIAHRQQGQQHRDVRACVREASSSIDRSSVAAASTGCTGKQEQQQQEGGDEPQRSASLRQPISRHCSQPRHPPSSRAAHSSPPPLAVCR